MGNRRQNNLTPAARHFAKAKPISTQFVYDPCPDRPANRKPIPRLAFGKLTAKEDITVKQLVDTLRRSALPELIVFPDTGFVTNPMSRSVWAALCEKSVAFCEATKGELSGWLANPFHNHFLTNVLSRGLTRSSKVPIGTDDLFRVVKVLTAFESTLEWLTIALADRSRFSPLGYEYYLKLLSLRKLVGMAAFQEFGMSPDEPTFEHDFMNFLQLKYGPRLAPLAFKGWKDFGKRNYLADEELVVTAVLTAIITGRETLILTWDNDVYEQFVALVHFLAADYSCYRFGEVRYFNPDGCPMFPMHLPDKIEQEVGFIGVDVEHVVISLDDLERLPPFEFRFVNSYCYLFGNNSVDLKLSEAVFCLEREMGGLLRVVGSTKGKNTMRFPGRNLVVGTHMNGEKPGAMFALGSQKHVLYQGVEVAWHDLQRALNGRPLFQTKYYRESDVLRAKAKIWMH